jgi:hypothetical protein
MSVSENNFIVIFIAASDQAPGWVRDLCEQSSLELALLDDAWRFPESDEIWDEFYRQESFEGLDMRLLATGAREYLNTKMKSRRWGLYGSDWLDVVERVDACIIDSITSWSTRPAPVDEWRQLARLEEFLMFHARRVTGDKRLLLRPPDMGEQAFVATALGIIEDADKSRPS